MGAVSVSRSSPPCKGWQGSSGESRSEEGIKSSLPRGPAALLLLGLLASSSQPHPRLACLAHRG